MRMRGGYIPISRENNFDFLRFMAASGVFLSHCWPLYGREPEFFARLSGNLDTLGGLCVSIFFIISGFLITASWCRNPSINTYLKNRSLRIFPGLAVIVLLSVFVVGPLLSPLSASDYFSQYQTYKYLRNIFLYTSTNALPEVFSANLHHTFNGSLWTLPVEFAMYLVVLGLGFLKILRPFIIALLLLHFFGAMLHLVNPKMTLMGGTVPVLYALKHGISFMSGMLLYMYYDRLPKTHYLFILALLVTLISLYTPYARTVIMVTLPYIIIHFSFLRIPALNHWAKYGDFSYGIYIYAFPVQQWVYSWYHGAPEKFLEYIFFSYALIVLFAVASWHGIEKWALRLK
jgi:peptidoglycan/LPS O-acetylase OafA/YrhL